jgi:hypothetical protein
MNDEEQPLPVTSSVCPEFSPEVTSCYGAAIISLAEAGIPFAVGGAFALQKHSGIWRYTKDLDLLLEARSLPAAIRALEDEGYETSIEDPVWLAKAYKGEYFVDLITAQANAALLVDAEWIRRAVPGEVFGIPCRIVAAEELIASKIFVARRERFDGADVAHLIRARGPHLEWERIERLLATHTEMLLWSLIFYAYIYPARAMEVPEEVWDRLLSDFEQRIWTPRVDEPFRGTLIDPNMFSIDVKEWGERNLYGEMVQQLPKSIEMPSRKKQ